MLRQSLVYLRTYETSRRLWVGVLSANLLFAVTEGAGFALMLPVLLYIQNGAAALSEGYGLWFARGLEAIGLPVNILTLLAVALGPFLLRQLAYYFQQVLTGVAQCNAEAAIRRRLAAAYLEAGIGFHLGRGPGALSTYVTVEAGRASSLLLAVMEIYTALLLLVVYLALMFMLSPILAAITLPLFAVAGLVVRKAIVRGRTLGQDMGTHVGKLGHTLSEMLQGIKVIKLRGFEARAAERIGVSIEALRRVGIDIKRVQVGVSAAMQPILLIGTFAVIWFAVDVLKMSLAGLGLFMLLLLRMIPLLVGINTWRVRGHTSIDCADGIENLIASVIPDVPVGGAEPFRRIEKGIRFEGVSFSYGRDGRRDTVLHGINLFLGRGEMVALVGRSGAGKSTIADLIPRFHDPDSGRILVDDRPLSEFDVKSLRSRIGFVSQDAVLFDDTIRANLSFGVDAEIPEDELWDALQRSHAFEFVAAMPNRLDTMVGERGVQLSGGQRQRLVLARALLVKPELLILDEPTSALDSVSEAEIQASLRALHGSLTMLVIAHRLATIRHSDRIIVIDDGRVKEEGRHEDLLGRDGAYRLLFDVQRNL